MQKSYTNDALLKAVKASTSYTQVLKKLNLSSAGGSGFYALKKAIKAQGIDISHFLGKGHWKNKHFSFCTKPVSEYFVDETHSKTYKHSNDVKKRILRDGLKENRCAICGMGPIWNGQVLSLQLDHINGNAMDNRLDNLRILCPNCHSQTATYSRGQYKKSL